MLRISGQTSIEIYLKDFLDFVSAGFLPLQIGKSVIQQKNWDRAYFIAETIGIRSHTLTILQLFF